jgi:outer membrane protein OmpA-like peptidoglycan-associated protein
MINRLLLAASVATLAIGTASAQTMEKEGYYGSVGIGAAFGAEDNDFESDGAVVPAPFDSSIDTQTGPAYYAALGKYLNGGFRGEIETSFRSQDIDSFEPNGGFGGFPGDNVGDVGLFTGMVNIIKDFGDARLRPYLGVGFGVAVFNLEADNSDIVNPGAFPNAQSLVANGYRVSLDDEDTVTAVQGLAGASFAVTDRIDLDVGYRYIQTGEFDFDADINNVSAPVSGEYSNHEVRAALRFDFGAPVAAPAPVAQPRPQPQPQTKTCFDGSVVAMGTPCPTAAEEDQLTAAELRTVVYFEFDRAELTDQADAILRRRAQEAETVDLIEVLVSGNTDTSGSASYNQRLSARRAEVVRNALVNYGVPQGKIRVRALGESNLAKPTADGVREPLNRRTEVEFDF